MVSWAEFEAAEPGLAARVKARFAAGTNKTIATLRRDGSPRISGTELRIDERGVTLGIMPHAMKLRDVQRDPRVAIHSPTLEPPEDPAGWAGEAKLSGRLRPVPPPAGGGTGAYFELDITEAVHIGLTPAADRLVVESWHPGRGYRRIERE